MERVSRYLLLFLESGGARHVTDKVRDKKPTQSLYYLTLEEEDTFIAVRFQTEDDLLLDVR